MNARSQPVDPVVDDVFTNRCCKLATFQRWARGARLAHRGAT